MIHTEQSDQLFQIQLIKFSLDRPFWIFQFRTKNTTQIWKQFELNAWLHFINKVLVLRCFIDVVILMRLARVFEDLRRQNRIVGFFRGNSPGLLDMRDYCDNLGQYQNSSGIVYICSRFLTNIARIGRCLILVFNGQRCFWNDLRL